MISSPPKLAVLTSREISRRVLLWLPLLEESSRNRLLSVFVFDDGLTESSVSPFAPGAKVPYAEIKDPSLLEGVEWVLFADTPENLCPELLQRLKVPYGCFFGGFNPANLIDQLVAARERNLAFLFSDLLPAEVEPFLDKENFSYFCRKSVFVPHASIDGLGNPSKDSNDLHYIFDSSVVGYGDYLDRVFFELFSENQTCKVSDLAEVGKFDDLLESLPSANCRKVVINSLPVSSSHFITDLCCLRDKELVVLKRNEGISMERGFLSRALFQKGSVSRRSDYRSLRKTFEQIIRLESVRSPSMSMPDLAKGFSLEEALESFFSKAEVDSGFSSATNLERLRRSNAMLRLRSSPQEGSPDHDPFGVLERTPRLLSLRNADFFAKTLDSGKGAPSWLDLFNESYSSEMLELFLEMETTDDLVHSFLRIMPGKEKWFLDNMLEAMREKVDFQRKIKVLRLFFFSFFSNGMQGKEFSHSFAHLSKTDVANEFKLLLSLALMDKAWLSENFIPIFNSCDKARFYKFFSYFLSHTLEHNEVTIFFLKEIFPKTKDKLPPSLYSFSEILKAILIDEDDSFVEEQILFIRELSVYERFKLILHARINKREVRNDQILKTLDSENAKNSPKSDALLLLAIMLVQPKPEDPESLSSAILASEEKMDLSAIHPYFYFLISSILSHSSGSESAMEDSQQLKNKFIHFEEGPVRKLIDPEVLGSTEFPSLGRLAKEINATFRAFL